MVIAAGKLDLAVDPEDAAEELVAWDTINSAAPRVTEQFFLSQERVQPDQLDGPATAGAALEAVDETGERGPVGVLHLVPGSLPGGDGGTAAVGQAAERGQHLPPQRGWWWWGNQELGARLGSTLSVKGEWFHLPSFLQLYCSRSARPAAQ